jgi:hypothetical protein
MLFVHTSSFINELEAGFLIPTKGIENNEQRLSKQHDYIECLLLESDENISTIQAIPNTMLYFSKGNKDLY